MKELSVLTTNVKTYFMTRLIEEVGKDLLIIDPLTQETIPTGPLLVRTSGVQRDDVDLRYLRGLPDGIKIFNSLDSLELFRSKDSQYQFFGHRKFPFLPWRDLSSGEIPGDLSELLNVSDSYLVKPRRGQGGWGVEIVRPQDFNLWWEEQTAKNDVDYVIQPYLKSARELRIFFCGDFKFCLERENDGAAANFRAGGRARETTLPEELTGTIERLILESGAGYGAIDLLLRHGQTWVLELNVVPGIEQAEALSGKNLIRLILNHFTS